MVLPTFRVGYLTSAQSRNFLISIAQRFVSYMSPDPAVLALTMLHAAFQGVTGSLEFFYLNVPTPVSTVSTCSLLGWVFLASYMNKDSFQPSSTLNLLCFLFPAQSILSQMWSVYTKSMEWHC